MPEGTSSPIGVNVDALVLLDALADGTVFDVEVLAPRAAWRSQQQGLNPPAVAQAGSIVISDPGPSIYVSRLSPRFTIDGRSRLHLELEPMGSETKWVALSPGCFALLNEDVLAGFLIQLPSEG